MIFIQLNEDLVGQIDFLAQTGPFSVPVKCFTKKCQVPFSPYIHYVLLYLTVYLVPVTFRVFRSALIKMR